MERDNRNNLSPLSWTSSETRPSVQTLSDVCLKRTCSLDTSAYSALEVLDDNRAPQIYLLTYQEIGSLNRENNAIITHPISQIPGYATDWNK